MRTRIISGAVIAVVMATALYLGGDVLFFLIAAASLVGLMELYRVLKINKTPLGVVGYIGAIVYFVFLRFGYSSLMLGLLAMVLVSVMTVYVVQFPKYSSEEVTMAFFGIMYVPFMLSFVYQIRMMNNGIYHVWLVFICSWVADTCAYFTGVTLGKHKFAPKLSPKKTIEGVIGGILGSMIIGLVYGFILHGIIEEEFFIPFVFSVASGVGAAISIVGDLAASAIKRGKNVKDYGKLIPGHGGILDRFDSVIFTAPTVYFVIYFFDKLLY